MANEIDALDPVPEQVKLASGTVVALEPLKARQFFKLLRIITHGAVPAMRELFSLDADTDPGQFGVTLLTVTLLSIPDAEDETVEFIQSMVKPVGLIEGRKLNKLDTERNEELWRGLDGELDNPELDDLITIIEAVVKREAADIQALGKRLAAMFKLAERTGQTKPQPSQPAPVSPSRTSPVETSSAVSVDPSTSSATSTAGPTTTLQTSLSDDSDSASQPSRSDASTPALSETAG